MSKPSKSLRQRIWHSQMAAMLTSGLTLVKALDILCKEQESEAARNVWRDVYENVQKGESFSDSLEVHGSVFPTLMTSMVGAGVLPVRWISSCSV